MTAQLLMVQAIAENIAFFSCAIFVGGAVYVSLVEDPATAEGGIELAGTYLLAADPQRAMRLLTRLTRQHAALSLAGLAALFIFIMKS